MKQAYIAVDLGFGDSGKGTVVDALTRWYGADLVVRFNGAGQAAHNVVTADGCHHCFSHFGSGSLAGAHTHLSQYMFIEPMALANEASVLSPKLGHDAMDTLSIDPRCVIITPYHQILNHAREKAHHHGSVGIGFGEAVADSLAGLTLTVENIQMGTAVPALWKIKYAIRELDYQVPTDLWESIDVHDIVLRYGRILDRIRVICTEIPLLDSNTTIFEGAQGVLIDQTHGCSPHTTWSDCTFNNAEQLLADINYTGPKERIGITRTYHTRHGNGPFPSEDSSLVIPEIHNGTHPWMGKFRLGHFDAGLYRHAVHCCGGVDVMAVTHMDIPSTGFVLMPRESLWSSKEDLVAGEWRDYVDKVKYISVGPRSDQKMRIK